MSGQIDLHFEVSGFQLNKERPVLQWLNECISQEEMAFDHLTFIFCSDDYLLDLNRKYLNHDYYTDVITFDYSTEKEISGDIFISVDRVSDNARQLQTDNESELHRVMIHGILHLCGYRDKSEDEQSQMRRKEDYYLSLRSF